MTGIRITKKALADISTKEKVRK